MSVQTQFSRYAYHYGEYNVVQRQVARKLVDDLGGERPQNVLDLGCGNGVLYEALAYAPRHFMGVDFAPGMLESHPKAPGVECIYGDFNDPALFEQLNAGYRFDRIFSGSALQWAQNLPRTFEMIASLHAPVSLAVFTDGTFATLLETAGLPPLLRSAETVREAASACFGQRGETVNYRLDFGSVREMFRYIKRSGVSGGRNALGYRETKRLMEAYPMRYLEFEVVFIRT